jgi:hypothetical protein
LVAADHVAQEPSLDPSEVKTEAIVLWEFARVLQRGKSLWPSVAVAVVQGAERWDRALISIRVLLGAPAVEALARALAELVDAAR